MDPPDGFRNALIAQEAEDVFPCRGGAMADVVALAEAVKARAVDLQEVQGAVDLRKLIEVDQEIEDPVEELMPLRCEPPVKDGALVEAGAERGIHGSHFMNLELMNSGMIYQEVLESYCRRYTGWLF